MAANLLHQAKADVAQLAKQPDKLAQKMVTYASSPLYLGEVAVLLVAQQQWEAQKKLLPAAIAAQAETAFGDVTGGTALGQHSNDLTPLLRPIGSPVVAEAFIAALVARAGFPLLQKLIAEQPAAARLQLGQILGQAELDGVLSTAQVQQLEQPTANHHDELGSAAVHQVAIAPSAAREQLAQAQAQLDALDKQLELELSEVGDGVAAGNTKDPATQARELADTKKFITAYQSSRAYTTAVAQWEAASAALGGALQRNAPEMLARAHDPNAVAAADDDRDALISSYEALAASANASEAVVWAKANETDAKTFSAKELARIAAVDTVGQSTHADRVLSTVQGILAQGLAAKPAAQQALIEQAIGVLSADVVAPYGHVKTMIGVSALGAQLAQVRTRWQIWRGAGGEEAQKLATEFFASVNATAWDNVLKRVWNGFGLASGALLGGNTLATMSQPDLLTVYNQSKSVRDKLIALKALFARAPKQGAQTAEQLAEAAAEAQKEFEHQAAGLVSSIRTDALQLLRQQALIGLPGLVGTAEGIEGSFQMTQAYPDNLALKVEFAANLASGVGSVLAMFPPLAPVGAVIATVGATVSMVASMFVGDPVGDARRSDERTTLETSGALGAPDPKTHQPTARTVALAGAFTTPASAANLHAATDAGLTTDQIQQLALAKRYLFDTDHMIATWIAVLKYLPAQAAKLGKFRAGTPTLLALLQSIHNGAAAEMVCVLGASLIEGSTPLNPIGLATYIGDATPLFTPSHRMADV